MHIMKHDISWALYYISHRHTHIMLDTLWNEARNQLRISSLLKKKKQKEKKAHKRPSERTKKSRKTRKNVVGAFWFVTLGTNLTLINKSLKWVLFSQWWLNCFWRNVLAHGTGTMGNEHISTDLRTNHSSWGRLLFCLNFCWRFIFERGPCDVMVTLMVRPFISLSSDNEWMNNRMNG